jgi:hypothetical protein
MALDHESLAHKSPRRPISRHQTPVPREELHRARRRRAGRRLPEPSLLPTRSSKTRGGGRLGGTS